MAFSNEKYAVLDSGKYRPYASLTEARTLVTTDMRTPGMTINVNYQEYWWRYDLTDSGLVFKKPENSTQFNTDEVQLMISASTGGGTSSLELGETDTTAYRGDRGKVAYDFSQSQGSSISKSFNSINRVGQILSNPVPVGKFIAPQRGFSDGVKLQQTFQYWFKPAFNCTGVQFIFPNWILGNSGVSAVEAIGLNNIIVKFTLYCNGFKQGYFDGAISKTISPGCTVVSDPLPYQLTAGSSYAIRVCVSVQTDNAKFPLALRTQPLSPSGQEGYGDGDMTLSGALTIGETLGYCPLGIIAKPTSKRTYATVGLFGDSIFDGNSNGGTGINLDQGWGRRGLDALGIPWIKFSLGGDVMLNHMGVNGLALQLTNCGGVDIAICNFGANDLAGSMTFQQAQTAYLNYWNALNSQGIRVIQSTVMPRTAFNGAQQTVRNQINDWIRTKPSPLYDVLEVADIVETGRGTNIWKTGYSTDGTHPNVATESIVAAVIKPEKFLL